MQTAVRARNANFEKRQISSFFPDFFIPVKKIKEKYIFAAERSPESARAVAVRNTIAKWRWSHVYYFHRTHSFS